MVIVDPTGVEKKIRRGRWCVIAFITVNLLALTAYLSYQQATLDKNGRKEALTWWNQVTAYFLIVAFTLHLVCILMLIIVLRRSRDSQVLVEHDRAFLDKEICKLTFVLIIFNSTYLIRALYDILAKPDDIPDVRMIVTA